MRLVLDAAGNWRFRLKVSARDSSLHARRQADWRSRARIEVLLDPLGLELDEARIAPFEGIEEGKGYRELNFQKPAGSLELACSQMYDIGEVQ
jgi:hypothetical protein